jgi:hypothetical protein
LSLKPNPDCTSPYGPPRTSLGWHVLQVRGIDSQGKVNLPASYVTWETTEPFETTPPETSIVNYADGEGRSTKETYSESMTISFSGSDNTGLKGFECRLDRSSFTPCQGEARYTNLRGGVHNFEVRSVDTAGNTDPSPAKFTWEILSETDPCTAKPWLPQC